MTGLVDIEDITSSVTRVFFADRIRARAGLDDDGAEALRQRFRISDVLMQEVQPQTWIARNGSHMVQPGRRVVIERIQGNIQELGAFVHGSTTDAVDTLNAAWDALAPFDGQPEVRLADVPGFDVFSTIAVFRSTRTFGDVVPLATEACAEIRRQLPEQFRSEGGEMLKLDVAMPVLMGGMVRTLNFRLERRTMAPTSEGVYWSQSPLNSDDHVALLNKLFAM